jgi:ABC-2 type transport system ATP-binding protein
MPGGSAAAMIKSNSMSCRFIVAQSGPRDPAYRGKALAGRVARLYHRHVAFRQDKLRRSNTMSLAIATDHLTRYFDDFCAVDGIKLAVQRGTFYGFLGPNGAGKSTTIKMLTGLLAPSGGHMFVLGKNMLDPREALEAKRRMGVIPEDLALFDNLTAREYLTFVGRIHLMDRDTIRTRCDELLSILDLQDDEKKLTLEFSHGMQKKLAMAAALLPNPDLLFLDEPFEGIDVVTSRVIRDLLAGFVARGSTVFLTSHVLEIVERLCTHVGIIVKGRLVEQDSLETIRQRGSLEDCFLEKAGADPEATRKLNWLEEAAS